MFSDHAGVEGHQLMNNVVATRCDLRPVGRFEWEQNLRRLRAQGLVGGSDKRGKNGRPTRGGVSGSLFKAVAMTLASWGELGGQEIYPGDAVVAVAAETSLKTVREVRTKLIDLGMLSLVTGPERVRVGEWRLTMPAELPAGVVMLTPAQFGLDAKRLRDAARGSRSSTTPAVPQRASAAASQRSAALCRIGGVADPADTPAVVEESGWGGPLDHPMAADAGMVGWSSGSPQPETVGDPVDTPAVVDTPVWGGPLDHPQTVPEDLLGWSGGPAETVLGWSSGAGWGGPVDSLTKPLPSQVNHQANPGQDLFTAVTGPRANPVHNPAPPTGRLVDRQADRGRPARLGSVMCPEHPAMRAGRRDDGRPVCTFCRRLGLHLVTTGLPDVGALDAAGRGGWGEAAVGRHSPAGHAGPAR
jgi:hypothetical protein